VARIQETPAGEPVRVVTDVLDLTLNTHGGDIVEAVLRQYPVDKDNPDTKVEILGSDAEQLYVSQSGLRAAGGASAPNHDTIYRTPSHEYMLADGADTLTVSFFWTSEDGIEVEKRYTFQRGRYEIGLDYLVRNNAQDAWRGDAYLHLKKRQLEHE